MKKLSVLSVALLIGFLVAACQGEIARAKYVFFIIGDGMGVDQVMGAEMFRAAQEGQIGTEAFCFSSFPVRNYISTYSAYNAVTCSSAAGTALACGVKTRNGYLGIDSLGRQTVESIAERFHERGIPVGIITSVGMNHATPGAFYAHQLDRNAYRAIARDAVERGFDVYGGGGIIDGVLPDSIDLHELFEEEGYTVTRGIGELRQSLSTAKKLLMLQEEPENSLPYAIDRQAGDLSLEEMTRGAIDFLSRRGNGFFLMVEGGKIDFACHNNDAAAAFHEVMDLDVSVRVAYDFYLRHPDETLIIVTADHETGGLTLGNGPYELDLDVLAHQRISMTAFTDRLRALRQESGGRVLWEDVRELISELFGFWDEVKISAADEKALRDCYRRTLENPSAELVKRIYSNEEPLAIVAVGIVNRLAHLSWASGGHSAGAVPLYVVGVGAEKFSGHLDNTDLPRLVMSVAD